MSIPEPHGWIVTIIAKNNTVITTHEQTANPGVAVIDYLFVHREIDLADIVSVLVTAITKEEDSS